MSTVEKIRAALPNGGSGVDDAILEYMAQIVEDTSLSAEELHDGVAPLLLESGVDEADVDGVVERLWRAVRGDAEAPVQAPSDDGPKLLDAPVIMLEKVRDFERDLSDRIRRELNLKEDLFTNSLIDTWSDPSEVLDEAAMKARAKSEKKQEKAERRGINRERNAATERNELLSKLTRAPVVLHEKGEFGSLVAGGAVDIHLDHITMEVGGLVMLEDTSVTIPYGRRFGLVGRNGVGKTTLLKHIAAKAFPGIPAQMQILHIEQEVQGTDVSVLQTVLNTDIEREALLREERAILAEEATEESGARLNKIYQRLEEIDAASAVPRASAILNGLGFTQEDQQRPTKEFSGGWRMRVSLAMALFIAPDILLLDEPTNHLDLHAVLWLENYLQHWKKTLIVVSHARDFLNNVVTDILQLQNKQLTRFKGDYDNYEERRAEAIKLAEKQIETQEARRAHIQSFIDRFRVSASRASLVQSRIKALQRMEKVTAAFIDPEIRFHFPDPDEITGQAQIQLVDVAFSYHPDGKPLFEHVDMTIKPDSRIGLVGPNGAGKSTLLKLIFGELQPTRGVITTTSKLRIERFTQHHVDQLNMKKSALEAFKQDHPTDPIQRIRAHLGSMGITGKLALQPIGTLSGGQKSRVALAKVTYTKPHMLFLDEPTNHLDLDTVQALIEGLINYNGALFVISHDEHLINAVCNELWVLDDRRLINFDGDFDDYKKLVRKKNGF